MKKLKKLKKSEYLALELHYKTKEVLDKTREILELKLNLIQSRKSSLKFMLTDLDRDYVRINSELKDFSKQYKSTEMNILLDKIRKRLGLKGKFGYHPDSLEVIE